MDRESLVRALARLAFPTEVVACFLGHSSSSLLVMAYPLAGCWAKWEQGKRHVEAVDQHIDVVVGPLKSRRVPFEPHCEAKSQLTETWVWAAPEFPDLSPLSVEIGDALNCFRRTMDHLAWNTVKRLGTNLGALKRRDRRGIAFPMAARWGTFEDAFKRGLPGVDLASPMGKLVKAYQPCGRGLRSTAMRALRDPGDRDKHRLLIPAFWFPEGWKFNLTTTPGVTILQSDLLIDTSRKVPLKSNQPLVRVRYTTHTLLTRSQVNLHAEATFIPALGGGWWMMPTLQAIRDLVAQLLRESAGAQGVPPGRDSSDRRQQVR